MSELPEITDIIIALFLIGVAVSGITEIFKIILKRIVSKTEEDPAWWQAAFRIIPISLGIIFGGYTLGLPWGALIGMAAGVLAATIYAKAKKLVTSFKSSDDFS